MYPPSVVDAPVKMSYPPGVPPERQMAIGQEVYGLLPGLGMYATLWLREHNRVCDILKAEHPTWDDEQLFQTTRLIIIGALDTRHFFPFSFMHSNNKLGTKPGNTGSVPTYQNLTYCMPLFIM